MKIRSYTSYSIHVVRSSPLYMILIMSFFYALIVNTSLFAQEKLYSQGNSLETRQYMMRILSEGRITKRNTSITFIQESNLAEYLIESHLVGEGTEVLIIPNKEDMFNFPTRGSWKFFFDKNDEMQEIRYYFQDNIYFSAIPFFSSLDFSLEIEGEMVYQNLRLPLSLQYFLNIPINEFFRQTREVLYWDWLSSTKEQQLYNDRARSFANYLNTTLRQERKIRLETKKVLDIVDFADVLTQADRINEDITIEKNYIQKNINATLLYTGVGTVDSSQFTPYDESGNPIAAYQDEYIAKYILNIQNFLSFFPDFYVSNNENEVPFLYSVEPDLESLYVEMYFLASKYPGRWYLVAITQRKQLESSIVTNTVGVEIIIPYFTTGGNFKILGYDMIQKYFDNISDKNSDILKYSYEKTALRVPNKNNLNLRR